MAEVLQSALITRPLKFSIWSACTALGVVALAGFIDSWGAMKAPVYLNQLISIYREAVSGWFGWLDFLVAPLLKWIGTILSLTLFLPPDWKELLVPIGLYFTRNALTNYNLNQSQIDNEAYQGPRDANSMYELGLRTDQRIIGRKIFAVVLGIWGIFIALVICVASGVAGGLNSSLLTVIVFIAGFIVYDLGSNLLLASLVGYEGQTWSASLTYHVKGRFPWNMLFGTTVLGVGLVVKLTYSFIPMKGIEAILMLLFITLVGIRDISISFRNARGKWRRMRRQGTYKQGSAVLWVIMITLLLFLPNLLR